MRTEHRVPRHPGLIHLEEFLCPPGVKQVDCAAHIDVPIQRVDEIACGKRGVSPETARLFSQALGRTPEFWITLQNRYDLARTKPAHKIGRLRRNA